MVKIPFKRGDFITYLTKPTSFAIYEGVDLYPSFEYAKLMSLAVWYSPYDYVQDKESGTWNQTERFLHATTNTECDMRFDVAGIGKWRKMTQAEINEAYKVMNKNNIYYNPKTLALYDDTATLIYELKGQEENNDETQEEEKNIEPIKYNGETIILTSNKAKDTLRNAAHKKNKTKTTTNTSPYYGYGGYWGGKYYDDYDGSYYGHYYD